jgi:hypothetical protein
MAQNYVVVAMCKKYMMNEITRKLLLKILEEYNDSKVFFWGGLYLLTPTNPLTSIKTVYVFPCFIRTKK